MKKLWLLVIPLLIIGIMQGQKINKQNKVDITPHIIVDESDTPGCVSTDKKTVSDKTFKIDSNFDQEIKVEHTTKVKIDQGGLRKKGVPDEPHIVEPPIPFEPLHPHRLTSVEPYPEAENIDILPKRTGKTWNMTKENEYKKGEMIIQLKNVARNRLEMGTKDGVVTFGIPALDYLNTRYNVSNIKHVWEKQTPKALKHGIDLIFVVTVPEDLDLEAVSEEYRKLDDVRGASPNYKKQLHDVPVQNPDDPNYDWAPQNTRNHNLWGSGYYGNSSVNIAEMEDVKYDHPDLNLNWSGVGYDFENDDPDPYGTAGDAHGTRCIGTAIAETNNDNNVAGTVGGWGGTAGMQFSAWQCAYVDQCIAAIDSAAEYGVDVQNISWGFPGNPAGLEAACEYAVSLGTVICASAGNDNSPEPGWPAYYACVIAVGGSDQNDEHWDWGTGSGSNYGPWVGICAPGDAQYTLNGSDGSDNTYGGTSFSSPRVTAACAIIKHTNPSWTPDQIRAGLIRSADVTDHLNPGFVGDMGGGRVNMYEARHLYNTNVAVNSILDVPTTTPAYASINPRTVVQNKGTGLATFDVIAEARLLGVVYADTVHVTDLAPNSEYQQNAVLCEFKKWIPTSGLYIFKIYTNMAGDLNRVNDTLTQTIFVQSAGAAVIDTLIYDQDDYTYYWSDADYYWAVRCSPAQPCSVISIYFYGHGTGNYSIYTWNDASGTPGSAVTGPQSYYNTSDGWKTVDITGYPYFTGDFHIGYQCPGGTGTGPHNTSDDGPGSGRSEYSANGSSWNVYAARNWQIRAIVKYPPPPTHDVMTQSIFVPTSHEITGMPVIPQAVVKNVGSSVETVFDVIMKIDSAGSEIYSDTKTVSMTMGKYDVDTITFDGWMPNYEGGTYNARCYHTLSIDGDRSNDTAYVDVLCTDTDTLLFDDGTAAFYSGDSVYAGVRFTLDNPANILGAEYLIWKEKSAASAPAVVACTVFVWDDAGGNPGTQLGQDTIMPPNTIGNQTYWHNWTLGSPIAHSGDFWCGIWQPGMVGTGGGGSSTYVYILFDAASESYRTKTSDDKSTWDTRTIDGMIRVIVQYSGTVNNHDVMTKEINEPGTIVSTLYDYPIKAKVKNVGANTETFDVVARITESEGPQVYQQTQNVSSLNPGEITSITFPDWQPSKAYDYYDLSVYTTLGTDVDRSNDTIIQDSIFSTPNELIWFDNGTAAYYWGDPDYRYTAQRFTPAAAGWCIGCWVAMYSDVNPWSDCSLFIWDDDDGWQGGGLPDPTAVRLSGPVGFDPGSTGNYWFYVSFPPIPVDTFADFFIGVWNAEPPHILMDDTTWQFRAFCAKHPDSAWQPIGNDLLLQAVMRYDYGAPPKSPYMYAQKNTAKDSIILYWQTITEDTLNVPTAIEWYEIYSDTNPGFVPASDDWLNSPSDTFFMELLSPLYPDTNRYYLNYAVSVYLKASAKSNMGYVFHKFLNENISASNRNWVSLPWHSGYTTVSDLTDDLSPSGDPLEKIVNLRDDQMYVSWLWDPDFLEWYGDDFAITPGRGYEIVTIIDTTLVLVGSNNPDGLISLNENPTATNRNWVSIPYNAVYSTVSDITTEYSPSGDPLEKIVNLRDDQMYVSWLWDPDFLEWYGDDFAITPGRGYEMVTIIDATWNPTEYTNESGMMLLAMRRDKKSNIEVYLGKSTEPDRAPVWLVKEDVDCKSPTLESKAEPNKKSDNLDADVYEPVAEKSKLESKKKIDYFNADVYEAIKGKTLKKQDYRDAGISHVVRVHLELKDFENFVFTAYRPDRPYDILTENIVGCGTVRKDSRGAIWFDVGNFKRPWQHGEEVILIIEATKEGKGYFTVLNFKLDKGVDIQELGKISLTPTPEPEIRAGVTSWNGVDNDNIVGYSLYQDDIRLNEKVVTRNEYSTQAEIVLKPVIKGGYETVYGSRGAPSNPIPLSYVFSTHPNPFAKKTAINYALPQSAKVEINIYDVSGRQVKTLVSERLEPGYYKTDWYGRDNIGRKVSTGIYFIRMNTKEFEFQQKIIFVH